MITVVIPCYNAALTIGEALDSAFSQAGAECRIVVVDDASTDGTCEAVRAHAAAERIELVRMERNSGPAAARNRGVAQARGEWVAFLDGDDVWLPGKLALQRKLAEANPEVALWCGGTVRWQAGAAPAAAPADAGFRRIELSEFAFHNPVATSTVLVRRSALEQTGGFDESFRGPEDYDLWMRIAADRPLAETDAALTGYRYVPGSLSNDDRNFLPQVLRVLDKAFAEGGALAGMQGLRRKARGTQYFSASWMAFNRGARLRALSLLARSWLLCPKRLPKEEGDALLRLRLLGRYLVGERVSG